MSNPLCVTRMIIVMAGLDHGNAFSSLTVLLTSHVKVLIISLKKTVEFAHLKLSEQRKGMVLLLKFRD